MSQAASHSQISRGQAAMLACLLEAAAPKVGNVHRGADFEDLSFNDFLMSAAAIGPAIEAAPQSGVGAAVLNAVEATRKFVPSNTNLGILLLIAPLALVNYNEPWTTGIARVLAGLTPADSAATYAAIRLANPGGLGQTAEMDVAHAAPVDLLAAMQAAAERDLIAKQYVDGFRLVLATADRLVTLLGQGRTLTDAIVRAHVELIAEQSDSLIARKRGAELAQRAQNFAQAVLRAGEPGDEDYYSALADFDFWLRADGHKRNPGATADLIAAALFVALRDGRLQPPFK